MDLARGALIAFVFRVTGMAFPLLVGVITSRTLGEAGRGDFTTALVVIAASGSLVASFSSAAGYFVSAGRRAPEEVASNAVALALGLGLLGLIVAAAAWGALRLAGQGSEPIVLLVGVALFPMVARHALGGVYLGGGMQARYGLSLYAPYYVAVGAMLIVLVGMDENRAGVAIALWIGSEYLAFAFLGLMGWRWWGWLAHHPPDWALIRGFLTFGTMTGLAGFVSYFNYRIDQLLVRAIDGAAGAGLYANAVSLAEALWVFSTVITVASYATIGQLSREEAGALTARATRHTLVVVVVGAGLLMVAAPYLLEGLFGANFREAAGAVRVLAVGTALWAPASILSNYFSLQLGRPVLPLALALCSCLVNVVVSLLLIPRYGYIGGAWGTAVSYGLTIGAAALLFRKTSGVPLRELWLVRRDDLAAYMRLARRVRAGRRSSEAVL